MVPYPGFSTIQLQLWGMWETLLVIMAMPRLCSLKLKGFWGTPRCYVKRPDSEGSGILQGTYTRNLES